MGWVEIHLKGQLDLDWTASFEGLRLAHSGPAETTLSGPIRDQAALFGLVARVRDLGFQLLELDYSHESNDETKITEASDHSCTQNSGSQTR